MRWLVSELRECDNLFYEIQNEPLGENFSKPQIMSWHVLGGPQDFLNISGIRSQRSVVWHSKIARIIAEAEKDLEYPHLIAQNVSKLKYTIREDDLEFFMFSLARLTDSVPARYAEPAGIILKLR